MEFSAQKQRLIQNGLQPAAPFAILPRLPEIQRWVGRAAGPARAQHAQFPRWFTLWHPCGAQGRCRNRV